MSEYFCEICQKKKKSSQKKHHQTHLESEIHNTKRIETSSRFLLCQNLKELKSIAQTI